MAIKGNIVIDQGSDYELKVNVENINNVSANLVGYTATAQMRKYHTSSRYYTFNTEVDAANGIVTLAMTANTTTKITPGRYLYDCELKSEDGVVTRLIEGIVTITPQITKNV